MPVSGQISIEQLSAWANLASRIQYDWTRPLKVTAGLIKSDAARNFDRGIGPDGRPWSGLSSITLGARRGGSLPLLDTGILRSSVTGGGKGHVEELTPRSLVIGSNLDYASTHQQGFRPNPGGLTITAKNVKNLAIPLTTEAVLTGSPRNFARALKWMPSRTRGTSFLYEQIGKEEKVRKGSRRGSGGAAFKVQPKDEKNRIFHYLLKKSVKIPQRMFIGMNEPLVTRIRQAFAEFLSGELGRM